MLLGQVQLFVELFYRIFEVEEGQLFVYVLHFEQNWLYYCQHFRTYRVDAYFVWWNKAVLVTVQLGKEPSNSFHVHLLNYWLRWLAYPWFGLPLLLLGGLFVELIEIISYVGTLTLPDSQVIDNRLEQFLSCVQIYFLFEDFIMNQVHQFFVLYLEIEFLSFDEVAFVFHQFVCYSTDVGLEGVLILVPTFSWDATLNFLLIRSQFLADNVQLRFKGALLNFRMNFVTEDLGSFNFSFFAFFHEIYFNGYLVPPPTFGYYLTDLVYFRFKCEFGIDFFNFVYFSFFFDDLQIIFLDLGLIIQSFGNIFADSADLLFRLAFSKRLVNTLHFIFFYYLDMAWFIKDLGFGCGSEIGYCFHDGLGMWVSFVIKFHHRFWWAQFSFLYLFFIDYFKYIVLFLFWVTSQSLFEMHKLLFFWCWRFLFQDKSILMVWLSIGSKEISL